MSSGGSGVYLSGIICAALLALLTGCVSGVGTPVSTTAGPVAIVPQRSWADAVLYFVIVDRFADGNPSNNGGVDLGNPGGWHGGDLAGLAAELDAISSLGATAIWITPVPLQIDYAPFAQGPPELGIEPFEHHGFHGYWAEDFTRLDPHFGTEADLAALVAAAHDRGLEVLLDVVYNHAGYGAQYESDERFAGWIRKKPVECAADPLNCQVGGLPDFVTERPEVRDHLFEATLGLAERTGVDGFRLDTVKHIDHAFWREHRALTRERLGSDFFLLGEVWGGDHRVLDEWFEGDEMDAGFDFSFKGSCQGFVLGRGRTVAFAAYLEKRHRVREGYHLAHYLSSHDEPMALAELEGDLDKFKLCVALQMTTLGIPVIYYGEEVARQGSVWPTNRNDMPWGKRDIPPGKGVQRDEALRAYYQQLIAIRREHPAFWRGDYARLSAEGELLVFARRHADDAVVVAVNRGATAAAVTVPKPGPWGPLAREALSGRTVELEGGELSIEVPAKTAHIYVLGSPALAMGD